MNLGWKLAATIRGDASDGLLDTYTAERHPIGARILDWTRAQVALMRPNRSSRALASIVRDLINTRDGATYFAERVWGVSLQYDLGGAHPLVGRSCPDFALDDGTRIGTLLGDGHGLLLDFGANAALRDWMDGGATGSRTSRAVPEMGWDRMPCLCAPMVLLRGRATLLQMLTKSVRQRRDGSCAAD